MEMLQNVQIQLLLLFYFPFLMEMYSLNLQQMLYPHLTVLYLIPMKSDIQLIIHKELIQQVYDLFYKIHIQHIKRTQYYQSLIIFDAKLLSDL